MASHVTERLRKLRDRAGYSMERIARELGYKNGSSYQRYESADEFRKDILPLNLIHKLDKALAGRGTPPITREEIFALGMIDPPSGKGSRDTVQNAGESPQTAGKEKSGNGRKVATKEPNGDIESPFGAAHIREVDVKASAGGGAVVDFENDSHLWMFPEAWVRAELSAKPTDLRIITIEGDSMVSDPVKPTDLDPGDKVIINVFDQRPTPPGVFIVYDGLGLVAKRVQFIPHSDPPTIKIVSNNKLYKAYERTLEEANVIGRIVGRLQRL